MLFRSKMTSVTIEHVSGQELPEVWRRQLHQRLGNFYRVTIEEEVLDQDSIELTKWGKVAERLKSNAHLQGCSDQATELMEGFREDLVL